MKHVARTLTGSSWQEIETRDEAREVTRKAGLGGMAACFDQDQNRRTGARYFTLVGLKGDPSATLRIGGGRLPPGPGGAEMTTREGHMAYDRECADPFVLHGAAIRLLGRTLGIEIPETAHVPIPGRRTQKRLGGLLPGRLVHDPDANPIEARERASAVDLEETVKVLATAAGLPADAERATVAVTRRDIGMALADDARTRTDGTGDVGAAVKILKAVPEAARLKAYVREEGFGLKETGEVLEGRSALQGLLDGFGGGRTRMIDLDLKDLARASDRIDVATLSGLLGEAASRPARPEIRALGTRRDAGGPER